MNGLKEIYNFTPKIGFELEFYLTQSNSQINDQKLIQDFIDRLFSALKEKRLAVLDIQKEQGLGQIEIKTLPNIEIDKLCLELESIKVISKELAKELNLFANFEAVPFDDDCANALQINLTLLDEDQNNLFQKKNGEESELLLNIIAGLLNKENINLFSNSDRFDINRNKELFKKGKYTSPVNLSWGYDNRSCAIRIVGKDQDRRLEFRIPDANVDIKAAISKFLEMVSNGVDDKLTAPKPIYGNAFDEQYGDVEKLT